MFRINKLETVSRPPANDNMSDRVLMFATILAKTQPRKGQSFDAYMRELRADMPLTDDEIAIAVNLAAAQCRSDAQKLLDEAELLERGDE